MVPKLSPSFFLKIIYTIAHFRCYLLLSLVFRCRGRISNTIFISCCSGLCLLISFVILILFLYICAQFLHFYNPCWLFNANNCHYIIIIFNHIYRDITLTIRTCVLHHSEVIVSLHDSIDWRDSLLFVAKKTLYITYNI